jgi:hypothetical protein
MVRHERLIPEFVAAIVFSAIVTGAIAVLGIASVGWVWILVGATLLSAAGAFAVHAWLLTDNCAQSVVALSGAVGCLVLLLVGVGSYIRWFDPALATQRSIEFFVPAEETQGVPLSGEPGGPPLRLDRNSRPLPPLYGGNSYPFSCRENLPDGSRWLRLEGTTYWAPEELLRPRAGADAGELPAC